MNTAESVVRYTASIMQQLTTWSILDSRQDIIVNPLTDDEARIIAHGWRRAVRYDTIARDIYISRQCIMTTGKESVT